MTDLLGDASEDDPEDAERTEAAMMTMANCRRYRAETDRRTLTDEPLCLDCADWYDKHEKSRLINQHALDEWGESQ